MEVMYNTKGVMIMYPLPILFGIMLILLNGYCCGAAVLVESNDTTFRCDGRLDEFLIQDDLELEFLINPYVSRLLQSGGDIPGQTSTDTKNPDNAVFKECTPAYTGCDRFGKSNNHNCNVFDPKSRCNNQNPSK